MENVNLKSIIENKRIIICTNPSELIPKTKEGRNRFELALKQLKKLNFHLIGFNKNTFEEHLFSVNWLNSHMEDFLVFPIYYLPKNEVKKNLEEMLSKEILIDNPIYFIDKSGITQYILNGDDIKSKNLESIVELASKMVLSDQNFANSINSLEN
ncbi:redoxin domain-containing protein [Cyclobacterium qasimii]|uniref:Alkyl hydroperoxide reductase subunit C/ Thiol specific antioxidant domain-containing protein n=1 Tax=Cyclobacterium qasimii M12-11B TaxID=641524 RepID=S7WU13_9BACT|nr:redoxin domain-containing protein [Cyclobacterium qasimii]EPR67598.1 hypothetical protein ADICYQ_3386 [Cyclobacterium qasimii M12-11B]